MNSALILLVLAAPPVNSTKDAETAYQRAKAAAKAEFERALDMAHKQYLDDLKTLQEKALKAKDVKKVVEIQKVIDAVKQKAAEKSEPQSDIRKRIAGTWWSWGRHRLHIGNGFWGVDTYKQVTPTGRKTEKSIDWVPMDRYSIRSKRGRDEIHFSRDYKRAFFYNPKGAMMLKPIPAPGKKSLFK